MVIEPEKKRHRKKMKENRQIMKDTMKDRETQHSIWRVSKTMQRNLLWKRLQKTINVTPDETDVYKSICLHQYDLLWYSSIYILLRVSNYLKNLKDPMSDSECTSHWSHPNLRKLSMHTYLDEFNYLRHDRLVLIEPVGSVNPSSIT